MNTDRIRLAKLQGWQQLDHYPDRWFNDAPAYRQEECRATEHLPDPFTDANDDYAMLEWIRNSADEPRFTDFRDALRAMTTMDSGAHRYSWSYEIGDYARAALKVIDNE